MAFEQIIRIYEQATVGDWQDRSLSEVAHILSTAGVPHNQAMPLLQDVADVRVYRFLDQAYALAQSTLPASVNGRLQQGLALAQSGQVHFHPDGTATVSHTYRINGRCHCPEAGEDAPVLDGRSVCQHLMAVWLLRKARQLAEETLGPAQIDISYRKFNQQGETHDRQQTLTPGPHPSSLRPTQRQVVPATAGISHHAKQ